jgi:acetyltransferase
MPRIIKMKTVVAYGAMLLFRNIINPYMDPEELRKLEKYVELEDGERVFLRPVEFTDFDALMSFFRRLSPQSIYNRWMSIKKTLPEEEARYYVNTDFGKDMAIYAFSKDGLMRGAVRLMGNDDNSVEFAIVVEDSWQNRGLGMEMMRYILEIARERNYNNVYGEIFRENQVMRKVCKLLGFSEKAIDPDVMRAEINL